MPLVKIDQENILRIYAALSSEQRKAIADLYEHRGPASELLRELENLGLATVEHKQEWSGVVPFDFSYWTTTEIGKYVGRFSAAKLIIDRMENTAMSREER